MKGPFHYIKSGTLNKFVQSKIKKLEADLKTRGKEHHLVKGQAYVIRSILADLRFVFAFIEDDWDTYSMLSSHLDRFALNRDLIDPKELQKFKKESDHYWGVHCDQRLRRKFRKFSLTEISRLDEGLSTLQVSAYFSSIVMSVSAVESRLHRLVKDHKPKQYRKDKLEYAPLGKLFGIVNSDRKYKSIREKLPQKYHSLINICNDYRIFSAHPKEEIMNYQDAVSIFGLSLSFLLTPTS